MRKDDLLAILGPAVSQRPYLPVDAESATPSAVLVVIHYHSLPNKPRFFLTKRNRSLKTHGGE
ncbi:MAG TPA: hypothetical protein VJL54_00230, partial [Nitrososphaera sp.]|nr:hypothetical protein [Nitrososphaera sp.]